MVIGQFAHSPRWITKQVLVELEDLYIEIDLQLGRQCLRIAGNSTELIIGADDGQARTPQRCQLVVQIGDIAVPGWYFVQATSSFEQAATREDGESKVHFDPSSSRC